VPFVEVVYDSTITEPMLRQLGELLPGLVAEAVACPEEPAVCHPGCGGRHAIVLACPAGRQPDRDGLRKRHGVG
jgi:hypothetical protein